MSLLKNKEKILDFAITVHGVSCHGSTPHLGKDAIVAASAVIGAAQTLVSRVNNPLRPLVLGFESVTAGKQFNIVCDKVQLTGTLRGYDEELLLEMAGKLNHLARRTAETFDCTSDMELLPGGGV